ncbi:MAG: hypothetical protein WCI11_02900 [Candidatus Methylumidiphilus sp.]
MDVDATRQKMEKIWHFSSIFPRESHFGNDVWKRFNPSIIWPVETIRNNYLVHTKYGHSNEKMMLAYCKKVLNGIQRGKKSEDSLTVKGLNYNFFQMDWAFENSALLGRPSMPSVLGTISNLSKLIKRSGQSSLLREEIDDIYCKIVYPALAASGSSTWFNIEKDAENQLEIREIKVFGLKNIDILIESLKCLRQELAKVCRGL